MMNLFLMTYSSDPFVLSFPRVQLLSFRSDFSANVIVFFERQFIIVSCLNRNENLMNTHALNRFQVFKSVGTLVQVVLCHEIL